MLGLSFGTQDLHCVLRDLSLWCGDSLVVACGLSCSEARGILAPKLMSPALQSGFSTTGPPEKSQKFTVEQRSNLLYIHLAGLCSVLKKNSVPVIYIPCDILRNFQEAPPSVHMGFPPACSTTPFFSDSASSRCPLTCRWPSEYVTGRMDHSTAGVSEPHTEYHELLMKSTWMHSGPSQDSESTVSMTHCPFNPQCLANRRCSVVFLDPPTHLFSDILFLTLLAALYMLSVLQKNWLQELISAQ